ncbi:MAG TPA: FKBP-type peptidyl-prolyl cis-trans isomerase [Steroidobacteraceae bacterium]|jgi:FKBP-type peptidyl-prolyl cis-trans isomerase
MKTRAILVLCLLVAASSAKEPESVHHQVPGFSYEILKSGSGSHPTRTSAVKVHYEGRFVDGKVFDTSPAEGVIFPVKALIPGFQAALLLMRAGDKWRVRIPPELAYGQEGAAPMGGKTLIFDMELVESAEMPKQPSPILSEMPH